MVTHEINQHLQVPPPGEAERYSDLHDDLRTFVTHRHVTPMQIKELSGGTVMGVWELRSYEEEPQMRLLGHFFGKHEFVGLLLRYRDDLFGTAWNADMRTVSERWKTLFPARSPKTTTIVAELFDGATDEDEKYFRE